jgi:hypothetical protein
MTYRQLEAMVANLMDAGFVPHKLSGQEVADLIDCGVIAPQNGEGLHLGADEVAIYAGHSAEGVTAYSLPA